MSDDSDLRTGMDTGSESGAPGDHLPEGPLDGEDLETLAVMLEPDDGDGAPVEPAEAGPGVESAVEDDSPLPGVGEGGGNADGLDARFVEPE